MVLKPVWRYTSVPVGQAGLPIPRKLLIPLPDSLSLPTFPTEHLFKKKKNLKKKRKKSHHREWVTNTAGKIHGEHWWEGASPSLASQQPVSYLHCSQVLCTAQAERGALPRNNNVYSSMPPTGVGRGQVRQGRERQRLMRVSVWETKAEASREI